MKGLAILTIGTEILEGQMIDRNSAIISEKLFARHVPVKFHLSVSDDSEAIINLLKWVMPQVDGLITTGGLGPTRDDFTRKVLAEFLDRKLIFDESNFKKIEKLLTERGVPVTPMQRQQSYFPEGAKVFKNDKGTADGFGMAENKKVFLVLPGPPLEVESILETALPWLLSQVSGRTEVVRHTFSFLGLGESQVAELFEGVFNPDSFEIGYRVHIPFVEVKVWYNPEQKLDFENARSQVQRAMESYLVFENDDDYIHKLAKSCEHLKMSNDDIILIRDGSEGQSFSNRLVPFFSKLFGNEHAEIHKHCKKNWETLKENKSCLVFSLSMVSNGLEISIHAPSGKSISKIFDYDSFRKSKYREHWVIESAIQWLIPNVYSLS